MNKEELLKKFGEPIKVGRHGMVRLVDVMGDDSSIVQAARVSYGAGTKAVSEDTALIRYLMRHQHTSPFEMCEIKLHIQAPIHVMRQWIRHRTASVNETSTRYSVVQDEFETFLPNEIRLQSTDNKQGSAGLLKDLKNEDGADELDASDMANDSINHAFTTYESLISLGVAREQARNILPLATYTQCYWKIDLHNLFHFLRLRLDPHAQKEIREFAEAITEILKDWVPTAYQAFVDYRLEGCYLSKAEVTLIRNLLKTSTHWTDCEEMLQMAGVSKREQNEFTRKFKLDE